ncbi:hypothetical protein Tco_1359756 [Tanacetum coccineum]
MNYRAFDPAIHWDKMEPVIGMRYETPHELKFALTNYDVARGYQMWFMKNDWRSVLVFCGRNVEEGRCAEKNGKKDRAVPNTDRSAEALIEKVLNESGEGTSNQVKRSKVKKVICIMDEFRAFFSNKVTHFRS